MVEQTYELGLIFNSLSDSTRRDVLRRLQGQALTISQLARHYALTFAGVAKHIDVLTRAGLVQKQRHGKEQVISINPQGLAAASHYLETYRQLWEARLDNLAEHLTSEPTEGG